MATLQSVSSLIYPLDLQTASGAQLHMRLAPFQFDGQVMSLSEAARLALAQKALTGQRCKARSIGSMKIDARSICLI
jgi:hypothetical protein